MKRIFIATVLALCALVGYNVMSQTNVTSVNVVGYKKVTIPASGKYQMVGMQFDAFTPTMLGIFGTNQLRLEAKGAPADRVFIWNTVSNKYDVFNLKTNIDGSIICVDSYGVASNPVISSGQAMWLVGAPSRPALDVTILGEVVDVATQRTTIVKGLQLITYPFTCDAIVTNLNFTNALPTAKGRPADQILLWNVNTSTYRPLNYKTNGLGGGNWYDGSDVLATDILYLGSAFFYRAGTNLNFIWEETNKYLQNLRQ